MELNCLYNQKKGKSLDFLFAFVAKLRLIFHFLPLIALCVYIVCDNTTVPCFGSIWCTVQSRIKIHCLTDDTGDNNLSQWWNEFQPPKIFNTWNKNFQPSYRILYKHFWNLYYESQLRYPSWADLNFFNFLFTFYDLRILSPKYKNICCQMIFEHEFCETFCYHLW